MEEKTQKLSRDRDATGGAALEPGPAMVPSGRRERSDGNLFSAFTRFLSNNDEISISETHFPSPDSPMRWMSRYSTASSMQDVPILSPNAYAMSTSQSRGVAEETSQSSTPYPASISPLQEPSQTTVDQLSPQNSANFTLPLVSSDDADTTPASSAPSDSVSPFACPECDLRFRTSGQKREHINRKHARRFVCLLCEKDFNLGADLKRHMNTVHKLEDTGKKGTDSTLCLRCPNIGCKSPDKIWDRKDNLTRHVGRCRKAIQRTAGIRNALE